MDYITRDCINVTEKNIEMLKLAHGAGSGGTQDYFLKLTEQLDLTIPEELKRSLVSEGKDWKMEPIYTEEAADLLVDQLRPQLLVQCLSAMTTGKAAAR